MKPKRVIIVGAGIAGLATAEEALRRGWEVLVVEKSPVWGGLTRSVEVNGCLLDLGPHLLFLRDTEVEARVREVVDEPQWISIARRGKLYIEGHYIDWPPRLQSALQLPFHVSIRVLRDQLFRKRNTMEVPPKTSSTSYEEELLAVYGKTLYHCMFGPLTRKFLKEDPRQVHRDWAYASIRAATKMPDKALLRQHRYVIEDDSQTARQEFNFLRYAIKAVRVNLQTEGFYYFKDGFGVLPNSFARKVLARGGEIRLETTVQQLLMEDNRVTHCLIEGKAEPCDALVWTGSLRALAEMLAIPFPPLQYLHTKFVYLFLKASRKAMQCCYFADPSVSFNRSTLLSNITPTVIKNPAYRDVLLLEYSYRNVDQMRAHHPQENPDTIRELQRVGLIRDAADIAAWHYEDAPFTYPILELSYREKLEELRRRLAVYRNVFAGGRQGTFGYNNSDLVIKEALHHPLFESMDTAGVMTTY